METALGTYDERFASIQVGLAREADRGRILIKELLEELQTAKTTLERLELDLESECVGRKYLQKELQESQKHTQKPEGRPFVVPLIDADADGYVFHDKFIKKGFEGGEDAADALLNELQRYVRDLTGESNEVEIIVRAFANMEGLSKALERNGRITEASQLRVFASGFSGRKNFFDFVDIGPGKERADFKVRENIGFYMDSPQCRHLVLACGHDSGYAPLLGQFVGDKRKEGRITVVEVLPFPAAIRNLGLKKKQFSSIFQSIKQPAPSPDFKKPVGAGASSSPTMKVPAGHGESVMQRMVVVPSTGGIHYNPQAKLNRFGSIQKDENGNRTDRKLQVDQELVERFKKESPCYHFFLRGECISRTCVREHKPRRLTKREFKALWYLARQNRCHKSGKADGDKGVTCLDPFCFYGHEGKGT